jgi:hypothetical protein
VVGTSLPEGMLAGPWATRAAPANPVHLDVRRSSLLTDRELLLEGFEDWVDWAASQEPGDPTRATRNPEPPHDLSTGVRQALTLRRILK